MNRRTFLKLCGVAAHGLAFGFATTGCASFPKNVNWSEVPDKEFSLDKFDDWFTFQKLYNGLNPNLKNKHISKWPTNTFKQSIDAQFGGSKISPGIDFNSNTLYAIAPCFITHVGTQYSRIGGNYAYFKHINLDSSIPHTHFFQSFYAHLGKIYPKYGKLINRGDIISDVADSHHAKLMFINDGSYADPDNYGEGHSYMRYELGDKEEITNLSERHQKQWKAFIQLLNSSNEDVQQKLADREHRPMFEHRMCNWDYVEKLRYLTELYQARPSFFADMPKDRFEELKSEFYANQPIVLTLPLKA